ncbi:MAG: CAP domain-containing protein, partial [Actinomycetota bacterium]|nr:CAP domain-containing protein [Actinomycetota bacterium]
MPIRRRLASAAIVLGLAATGVLVAPLTAQAAASVSIPNAVAQILADTNALRVAGGLAPLVESTAIDTVAQNWSAQMSANGALTHNPNYSTQIPAGWTGAAENIASGYTTTTVVEAWHQSAGHYANIMGSYNAIGIGYYEANGQTYFTQDFGSYATVPSPAPASSPSPTATPSTTPTPTPPATAAPAPTRAPTVADSPATSGRPILPTGAALGSFDSATAAFQGIRVTGWAVDPSTAASVAISVTVDGKSAAGTANATLNWFPLLYPGYGTNHGFDVVVPASAGWHTVCV